ncbi:CATL2 protein, partial [Polypterus senegalus]
MKRLNNVQVKHLSNEGQDLRFSLKHCLSGGIFTNIIRTHMPQICLRYGIASVFLRKQVEQQAQSYRSNEEEVHRKEIWLANRKYVLLHNMEADQGIKSYMLGMNFFADLTNQEYRQITFKGCLGRFNSTKLRQVSTLLWQREGNFLPTSVDWRNQGYVTDVKDQKECGSCWAFSADGACRYNPDTIGATCSGYVVIPNGSEKALQTAVATIGPVSVAIDAGHISFQLYESGIYNEPQCSSENLDHGVLAVGYGTKNNQDYWLVKNSFPQWSCSRHRYQQLRPPLLTLVPTDDICSEPYNSTVGIVANDNVTYKALQLCPQITSCIKQLI